MPVLLRLCFLILLPVSLCAQPLADRDAHEDLLRGIELSGHQRYREARVCFDKVIARLPQHPAGYLNKAILLEVMSLDFETPVSKEFLTLLDRSRVLSEAMLARNAKDPDALYHLGMTHSYLAYATFRNGENWIAGLRHGLTAYDHLKDCLVQRPSAYDAMTGAGTYMYWKSRKMSLLTWTPFVDDERDQGIRLLRMAESRATYTKAQATNALIWIFIEEERYPDAMKAARMMGKRYPSNRLFLWGLASAAERAGDYATARDAYQTILGTVDGEVTERRYIEIQAHGKLASMHAKLGEWEKARIHFEWVRDHGYGDVTGLSDDGIERIRKRRSETEEYFSWQKKNR